MSRHATIRLAHPEDHDRIAELTLASYRSLPVPMSADYEAVLSDVSSRTGAGTEVLVAEQNGEVVGSVTLVIGDVPCFEHRYPADGDCGFRMLAVDPARAGQGAGRALVAACLDRAADAGCRRMVITSMTWMEAAHELYRTIGFRRAPELDRRYRSGLGLAFALDLDVRLDRRVC